MKVKRRFIIQSEQPKREDLNVSNFINDTVDCVEEDLDGFVTAKTVSENFRKYGGEYVRYMCYYGHRRKWRIFYSDGNNIYLISDDCIQSYMVPKGGAIGKIYPNYGIPKENSLVIWDKLPEISIINNYSHCAYEIIRNSKDLLSYQNLNGIENNNIKVVAYMLDRSIWNGFANDRYAEYAIGGPTLDILFKSYNKKEGKNYMYRTSGCGYEISVDNGITWKNNFVHLFEGTRLCDYNLLEDKNLYEGLDDYFINRFRNFHGYWLASPSSVRTNSLLSVKGGSIYSEDFYDRIDFNIGFRPVVCLKSDVKLKPVSEKLYELVL